MNPSRKVIMGHSDVAPSLCEAKFEAIDTIMIFYSHANKTHFQKKGVALSLVWNSESAYFKIALNSKTFKISNAQILTG